MRERAFQQIDVFTAVPYRGNPVAVVLDAEGLSDEEMQRFARWTNLSETTFVLAPTDAEADYRLRIFTPGGELPFAGHPTLGSAHAWLAAGGSGRADGATLVQECGVGLVTIRRGSAAGPDRLAFAAPPLLRTGPVDEELLGRAAKGLGISRESILGHAWLDNGPGWFALRLATAAEVLAIRPEAAALTGLRIGVVAPHPAGYDTDFEVRAFVTDLGVDEDPVTGSLNAGIGMWLIDSGLAPSSYIASQGAALQRAGRVHIDRADDGITWVGGDCVSCVVGSVSL